MLCSDFDYHLPEELIAQEPLHERDQSRMLVVDRSNGTFLDSSFAQLPSWLRDGDVVVLNNTRVFPARLIGHRFHNGVAGAEVEALLLSRVSENSNEWEVVGRPGRVLRKGVELLFGDGSLKGVVTAELEHGRRRIQFEAVGDFDRAVDRIGNTPLPPYIKRERGESQDRLEEPRYQTVFASQRGAIAAPTAGLHFTETVLDELRKREIAIVEITHHVGYATFQPIRVTHVEEHRIDAESFEISEGAADLINRRKRDGGRLVAIGTTTVRALESSAGKENTVSAGKGTTSLFIYPGYEFRAVDVLLTNFHLPASSLLMLVSALGGRDLVLRAYGHAVEARYRFYSYGDCMLIT
jgi:S-adenosylmethionine:tRNA ribosyltransferase-isomerase